VKTRWILFGMALAALGAGAAVAALRSPTGLAGTVVDEKSGRVAAGARIIYGGRVLQRFRDKAFVFSKAPPDAATLIAEAPGYERVELEIPRASSPVTVRMKPVSIPGLSGVVVFPKAAGTALDMTAELLDRDGRAMSEFPAVDLEARLIMAGGDGAPLGYIDLAPRIDYSGPGVAVRLAADRGEIERITGGSPALFLVTVKAGEAVVASRPFAHPPVPSGSPP
jgi:hypothetical protein